MGDRQISRVFSKLDLLDIYDQYSADKGPHKEKTIKRLSQEYQCDEKLISAVLHLIIFQEIKLDSWPQKGRQITIEDTQDDADTTKKGMKMDETNNVSLTGSYTNAPQPNNKTGNNDRINESRVMKQDGRAKIIEYRNSRDIDIQFEDGTIRQHVEYGAFKRGQVCKKPRRSGKCKKNIKPEMHDQANGIQVDSPGIQTKNTEHAVSQKASTEPVLLTEKPAAQEMPAKAKDVPERKEQSKPAEVIKETIGIGLTDSENEYCKILLQREIEKLEEELGRLHSEIAMLQLKKQRACVLQQKFEKAGNPPVELP